MLLAFLPFNFVIRMQKKHSFTVFNTSNDFLHWNFFSLPTNKNQFSHSEFIFNVPFYTSPPTVFYMFFFLLLLLFKTLVTM